MSFFSIGLSTTPCQRVGEGEEEWWVEVIDLILELSRSWMMVHHLLWFLVLDAMVSIYSCYVSLFFVYPWLLHDYLYVVLLFQNANQGMLSLPRADLETYLEFLSLCIVMKQLSQELIDPSLVGFRRGKPVGATVKLYVQLYFLSSLI